MHKYLLSIALIAAATGLSLFIWKDYGDSTIQIVEPPAPARHLPAVEQQLTTATVPTDASLRDVLLADENVISYLKRRSEKDDLKNYFAKDTTSAAEDAETWQLIETIEAQGRVLAFEALHLKMAWLEKNSNNQQQFEVSAKALMEKYRQQALQSQTLDNPEARPEFKNYKQAETDIIREVSAMTRFPNGQTKQQYLRQRLLAARMQAYGEN